MICIYMHEKTGKLFSFRRNQIFSNMTSSLAFILTAYPSCSVLPPHCTSGGQHDWLTRKPSGSHFTSPVCHPLFTHTFAQPSEYYHCNWAREFQVSKEWLYVHNSVLPHSSQYIGDYVTIRWILTIETNNINFISNTNETDTQTSHHIEVVFSLWCSPEGSYHSTYVKYGIRNIRHEYRRQNQKCPVLMSSLCHIYVTERATFKAFQIVNQSYLPFQNYCTNSHWR